MFLLKIFAISIFIFSCSNFSTNLVRRGELPLKGGRYGNQEWNQVLPFKRLSWYQGMTLVFDLLYTKVEQGSPFYRWFSQSERETLEQCQDHYVVMSYELDSQNISRRKFLNKVEKFGHRRIYLGHFERYIQTHPGGESLSLSLYRTYGLCSRRHQKNDVILDFPGFKQVRL